MIPGAWLCRLRLHRWEPWRPEPFLMSLVARGIRITRARRCVRCDRAQLSTAEMLTVDRYPGRGLRRWAMGFSVCMFTIAGMSYTIEPTGAMALVLYGPPLVVALCCWAICAIKWREIEREIQRPPEENNA